ncbi:hypothetical protein [Lysobacter sp. D1-1-M9]|uniref:hypothetical protein n=1 Tax=Novilysobacter longmucuonensis TaxID=3098603 RepID=UPI002FCA5743
MSWLGILIVVVVGYLALKAAGLVLKLVLWGVVLLGLYLVLAALLGLPAPF